MNINQFIQIYVDPAMFSLGQFQLKFEFSFCQIKLKNYYVVCFDF